MLPIGGSTIILLIVILSGIGINAKIIVTEIVEVANEPKIGIATRYKHSDIVFSNKTRQLATKKQKFSDMASIPTIRMEYEGSVSRRWRHVKGDTNIYLFKTMIDQAQLQTFLNEHNNSHRERMLLIDKKYEGIANKWMKNDYFCLYGQSDLINQNIQKFLQECLKNRLQHAKAVQQTQQQVTQSSNSTIIIIMLLSISLLTSSKLLYFQYLCKQESVV